MEAADPSLIENGSITIELDGERFTLGKETFEVVRMKQKVTGEKVIPHVIEPSHGLDRIIYTCLEHAYTQKGGKIPSFV